MTVIFRQHDAHQRQVRAQRANAYAELALATSLACEKDERELGELAEPSTARNRTQRAKLTSLRAAQERALYERSFELAARRDARPAPEQAALPVATVATATAPSTDAGTDRSRHRQQRRG